MRRTLHGASLSRHRSSVLHVSAMFCRKVYRVARTLCIRLALVRRKRQKQTGSEPIAKRAVCSAFTQLPAWRRQLPGGVPTSCEKVRVK